MTTKHLQISGMVKQSIVDGSGLRFVLFVQGCPHLCPNCHNPNTHPFDGGYTMSADEIFAEIQKNPLISGVTLSGGEPFCQAEALVPVAENVKQLGKNIWIYSGYTFEELAEMSKATPAIGALLALCDVLVDGRYVHEQRDLTLFFRGSKNQRVLQLENGRIEKVVEG